jgi:hypothetical protein
MSSAFFPLGMNSMPSSGYNHKSSYYNKQYITWKGTGINSNPVGIVSGHIRPLTNNDPGNMFKTGFGLPRPIKHYRKGRVIPQEPVTDYPNIIKADPENGSIQLDIDENSLINYNLNRFVKSSKGTSLGGGSGGSGLLNDMQDKPGAYLIKQNQICQWNETYQNFNSNENNSLFFSRLKQSGDGKYLICPNLNFSFGGQDNNILLSNNFGNSWEKNEITNYIGGIGNALSYNGQYQLISNIYYGEPLLDYSKNIILFLSNNYGNSFNQVNIIQPIQETSGSLFIFDTITMTTDGNYSIIVANENFGDGTFNKSYIYKLNNITGTYTQIIGFDSTNQIFSIAISKDSQFISISTANNNIYQISNDYGSTWNLSNLNYSNTLLSSWVRMSYDGKYQVSIGLYTNNNIFYSNNYGNNWYLSNVINNNIIWNDVNISPNGNKIIVLGQDYTLGKNILYISNNYGKSFIPYIELPNNNSIIPQNIPSYTPPVYLLQSISINNCEINYSQVSNINNLNEIYNSFTNIYKYNCPELCNEICKNCEGIKIIDNYYPNKGYLTENPEPNTTNPILCCNEEYKAKRRVIYANTNLKKNYYTSSKQYLQNRCKTYQQKAFNFLSYKTNEEGPYDNNNPYYISVDGNNGPKPGGPLSLANIYLANCQLNTQLYEGSELAFINILLNIMLNNNILNQSQVNSFNNTGINSIQGFFDWIQGLSEPEKTKANLVFKTFIDNPYWGMPPSGPTNPAGCQLTTYKPNNYQFAKQGAVDSSTRNLKLNVDTISTNASAIYNKNGVYYKNKGPGLIDANQLYSGVNNNIINYEKNKAPNCNTPYPLNFNQSGQFQNKKYCRFRNLNKLLKRNQVPFDLYLSQPSPYRNFGSSVFNTNRYSQSPNTYNTTTGSAPY